MLSTGRSAGRRAVELGARLALGLAVVAGLLLAVGVTSAYACGITIGDSAAEYCNQDAEDADPGGTGSSGGSGGTGGNNGGGSEPPCDITLARGLGDAQWCEGDGYACWANIPSAVYPEPADWPEEPPTPDSVYIYKSCNNGTDRYTSWGWQTPDQPSTEELAWQAYGRLTLPEFSLAFNPPGSTIIRIETWWWAAGAGPGAVTGSSAAGLVAIAEPKEMLIEPGDGSRRFSCEWSVTKSDTCTYTYQRASDGYPARAQLVYTVRFEDGGTPIEVPGLPETIETPWQETVVPVNEVQAIVVP